MSLIWFCVLIIYGIVEGFAQIPGLLWWLLVPMLVQDSYDVKKR
jgi:hypothetical protein